MADHKLVVVNYTATDLPDHPGERRDLEFPPSVECELAADGWEIVNASTAWLSHRLLVTLLCRRDTST